MSWNRRVRARAISSLDLHPNLAEILGILNRMQRLTIAEIATLAGHWRDTAFVAHARGRALAPDSPLVIEVLSAFDRVDTSFYEDFDLIAADEIVGSDGSSTTVKPQVGSTALKAIRDAVAAAYARPVLPRREYLALIAPWHGAISPTP
ncbi:MAG TPA: hypothetical protein VIL94_08310 [Acidothermaceae bacterium]